MEQQPSSSPAPRGEFDTCVDFSSSGGRRKEGCALPCRREEEDEEISDEHENDVEESEDEKEARLEDTAGEEAKEDEATAAGIVVVIFRFISTSPPFPLISVVVERFRWGAVAAAAFPQPRRIRSFLFRIVYEAGRKGSFDHKAFRLRGLERDEHTKEEDEAVCGGGGVLHV